VHGASAREAKSLYAKSSKSLPNCRSTVQLGCQLAELTSVGRFDLVEAQVPQRLPVQQLQR
jgi:hypothetical protein